MTLKKLKVTINRGRLTEPGVIHTVAAGDDEKPVCDDPAEN